MAGPGKNKGEEKRCRTFRILDQQPAGFLLVAEDADEVG